MGCDPSLTSGQAGLSWSGKLMPGCDSGPNSAPSAAIAGICAPSSCVSVRGGGDSGCQLQASILGFRVSDLAFPHIALVGGGREGPLAGTRASRTEVRKCSFWAVKSPVCQLAYPLGPSKDGHDFLTSRDTS